MKIIFRVDASSEIGTGHVMRCLTLAEQLKDFKAQIVFICIEAEGHLCDFISKNGFEVYKLPVFYSESSDKYDNTAQQVIDWVIENDYYADWLIIDHYRIDEDWERKIRPYVNKIMVIDDLANRRHDCDILLDQNLYNQMEQRYRGLVPDACRLFLGPANVLLRKEFYEARSNLRKRSSEVNRILVFFGGSDSTGETFKTLLAIKNLNMQGIHVDVVVGSSNLRKNDIEQICMETRNMTFYCQITHMADLIAKADLGIGAGGATTWERLYLGLPSITIIVAENQEELTLELAQRQLTWNLGWHNEVTAQQIADTIAFAIKNSVKLRNMGESALQLMSAADNQTSPIIQELRRNVIDS